MTILDIENELDRLNKEFDDLFDQIIDNVALEDKTLKEALKTQLPMQLQIESLAKQAAYLYDNMEVALEDAYGQAIRTQMSDGYKTVSISEAKMYAATDTNYKHAKRLMAKVRKLRDEVKGSRDVIDSRKYTLHSMTNAIVAGAENTIL